MSILLVYPAVLLMVAVVAMIARYMGPRPVAPRRGRPILRTLAFVVGVLLAAPIMALIGFAGVAKRLS
jgi:hypothetical protein